MNRLKEPETVETHRTEHTQDHSIDPGNHAASKEPDSGPDQRGKSTKQLDMIIQQNASSSEERASTAEELATQSESLEEMISFFKTDTKAEIFNTALGKAIQGVVAPVKKTKNQVENTQKTLPLLIMPQMVARISMFRQDQMPKTGIT